MSGTIAAGKKAAKTNKEKHGKDFYANIGRKGGKASGTGGFASNKIGKDGLTGLERAKLAGQKGGLKSRRKAWTKKQRQEHHAAKKLQAVLANFIESPEV